MGRIILHLMGIIGSAQSTDPKTVQQACEDINIRPACATHLKPRPLPMNCRRVAIRTGNVAAGLMGAPSAVHCARKVVYLGPAGRQTRNSRKRLPLRVLKLASPSPIQSPTRPRHARQNALSLRDTPGQVVCYTTSQALSRGAPSLSSQAEYSPLDGWQRFGGST